MTNNSIYELKKDIDALVAHYPNRHLFKEATASAIRPILDRHSNQQDKIIEIGAGLGWLVELLPKYIQTDSAMFYPKAFNKVFGEGKRKHNLRTEHKIINTLKTGKYNARIETVFSKIKDRVDDFRGLKALWSATILLQGIILQHNFIEAHTTTGQVPSELAGLKQNLGVNRWLGLIKLIHKEPML